jgi:Tetratricopeptide repeat
MKPQENIDRYLRGELSPDERQQFDDALAQDENLAKDLGFHVDVERFLKKRDQRQALQANLKEIGADFFQPAKTVPLQRNNNLRWIIGIAAVLAAVMIGRTLLRPSLYEQYAQYPELSLTEKSSSADASVGTIEAAFGAKDYAKARPLLENYLKTYPNSQQARLYAGICAIELKDYEVGRQYLQALSETEGPFRDYAYWYSALSWLKEDKKAECQKALQAMPSDSEFFGKAQDLLKKL